MYVYNKSHISIYLRSFPLRFSETSSSPSDPGPIGINNCKQPFSRMLPCTKKSNIPSRYHLSWEWCIFKRPCHYSWKKLFTVFIPTALFHIALFNRVIQRWGNFIFFSLLCNIIGQLLTLKVIKKLLKQWFKIWSEIWFKW